ncbi:uncharacterized protein LOC142349807 [Convolutriloba macropyga]|uniref:uncharacterized protein LOC142349807 n=1 Tax=Convolutriloba macropyga TaxID=536237 RepID=UPI003F51F8D1
MQCADDIFAIKNKLISSVDKNFCVVDQDRLNQILSMLEAYPMTQAELEQTRIGKCINEVRKKTTDASLAKRAKELVKKWQRVINLHAVKTNSDSPKISLPSSLISRNRVTTPNHSNSCSPTSDYTASSPALNSQLSAKYENGIKHTPQHSVVCTCTSFDEHIVKCENAKGKYPQNGTNCSDSAIVETNEKSPETIVSNNIPDISLNHTIRTEIPFENQSDQFVPKAVPEPHSSKGSDDQKLFTSESSDVVEGVLGNSDRERCFREWEEVVELGTEAEPLFVLPYTVID